MRALARLLRPSPARPPARLPARPLVHLPTRSHASQTCEAWLAKMDANKGEALAVLEGVYGKQERLRRYVNWRLFFLACAELFGYRDGNEWAVSHYRFVKPAAPAPAAAVAAPAPEAATQQ